jgi:Protein of unknown function (DUF2939)
MRNWLIGLMLAAAALLGGWYYASPFYAMSQLRDAAKAGDEAALEARVDFPALRDDLKQEASAAMAREIADNPENPLGAAGATFGMALVGPMIDAFVNPDMIARLVREGKTGNADAEEVPSEQAGEADWQVERNGLSTFIARPVSDDGEPGPELEFARDGLGWRLVGMNLPDEPVPAGEGV